MLCIYIFLTKLPEQIPIAKIDGLDQKLMLRFHLRHKEYFVDSFLIKK